MKTFQSNFLTYILSLILIGYLTAPKNCSKIFRLKQNIKSTNIIAT